MMWMKVEVGVTASGDTADACQRLLIFPVLVCSCFPRNERTFSGECRNVSTLFSKDFSGDFLTAITPMAWLIRQAER
jgi:hypothetical protein